MVEIQVKKKHKLTPYETQNMLFSDQLIDNQYVRIAPVIKSYQVSMFSLIYVYSLIQA